MAKNSTITLKDIKIKNDDILSIYKEIRKDARNFKNNHVLAIINKTDLSIDFKASIMKDITQENIDNLMQLTNIIYEAILDANELVKKGTEYGVQLAFNRINDLIRDRSLIQSPYLIEAYRTFEKNLWTVIKLRELAYGEIIRLKTKQDAITKSALMESDSMMRVRYFEDIRVLEKDILRLEGEAHKYDSYQTALHSDKILKNVLENYSIPKTNQLEFHDFENIVQKYGGNK